MADAREVAGGSSAQGETDADTDEATPQSSDEPVPENTPEPAAENDNALAEQLPATGTD